MNEIKCSIEGCLEVFRTTEPVSKDVRFICKNHPKEVQVRAVGRVYNPKTDGADEEVRFQTHQFDADDLDRCSGPDREVEGDDTSDVMQDVDPIKRPVK